MKKKCTLCKEEKELEEFSFKNKSIGTRHSACKSCRRMVDNEYYKTTPKRQKNVRATRSLKKRNQKLFIWKYLETHPCVDCGETDPVVLEFDHVRGKKDIEISQLVNKGYSDSRLLKEVEKCDVRCANCHRKKTAIRGNFYTWLDSSEGRTPD